MPTSTLSDFDDSSESRKMTILWMGLMEIYPKVMRHDELLVTGGASEVTIPERMRNVEKFVDNIRFWSRFVGTAILLQTLTFGGAAIWYAIKMYPILERIANQP